MDNNNKVLSVEAPYKDVVEWPWNVQTQAHFKLDSADIAKLEEGGIVWNGDIALSLDDPQPGDSNQ